MFLFKYLSNTKVLGNGLSYMMEHDILVLYKVQFPLTNGMIIPCGDHMVFLPLAQDPPGNLQP